MKKWINIIFCTIFFCCLICPLLTMNFSHDQESEIDNAFLPELEPFGAPTFIASAEEYVAKRIGFRAEALSMYQKLNDAVFGLMEHPNYMYGSEGHVFFSDPVFIKRYQHLDLNQASADLFAQAMSGFQTYAEAKGKMFLYWLLPDKESVYPEFYPSSINVMGDESYTDQILSSLSEYRVNYLFVKNAMVEGKKSMLVNNIKYDAGHWNDNGAFVSALELYSVLRQQFPSIEPPRMEEYTVGTKTETSLDTSHFEINEAVPFYELIEIQSEDLSRQLRKEVYLSSPENYAYHYVNPQQEDKPSILFFSDSYLVNHTKFFREKFSESIFIHRYNCLNQEAFEYYVDYYDPDIVIFENPERSHPIDLYQEFSRP